MIQRTPTSHAKREANRAFKPPKPEKQTNEYAKLQRAFHDNRERLKSERLAREANTAELSRKRQPSS